MEKVVQKVAIAQLYFGQPVHAEPKRPERGTDPPTIAL